MTETTSITLQTLSAKGRARGYFNHFPVEILGGVPGDQITAVLGKKKRGIYHPFLYDLQEPSALRVEARCAHFPECGGCSMQSLAYEEQLRWKQSNIQALFAEYSEATLHPIIPCDDAWHYRNKMEFSFSQDKQGNRFLGLIKAGASRVCDLQECHLCPESFMDVLKSARTWWESSGLDAYHLHRDIGSLRCLTIRYGMHTSDMMVILTVSGNPDYAIPKEQLAAFVESVKAVTKDTVSIILKIHQIQKGVPTQFFEQVLYGKDYINEELWLDRKLKLKISPDSFFQPNTYQAEKLYAKAADMLKGIEKKVLLDLYCGTGTIGMALAFAAEKVIGIELNPYAVYDARENLQVNGITNMEVHCEDAANTLDLLRKQNIEKIDVAVIDPPRSGLDNKAMLQIETIAPNAILYISCHPKTQKENIKNFIMFGYEVKEIQPVDQFPHTPHIENIILLQRK